MKINARLKTIGDLVEKDSICLDVGCDHALLDIYLVHRKSNIKTIASDIAQGPLEQAKTNIEREHLEEVGKEFMVTRERIRQIEAKALRKLRHPSRSKKLKDYMN